MALFKKDKKSKLSTKEQNIRDAIKQTFMDKEEACIACLTKECWDTDFGSDIWAFYEKKTRKLVSGLVSEFARISASEVFSDAPKENKLRLITVRKCPHHKQFRSYKLVHAAEEWENVHARSVSRQEAMMNIHGIRMEESIRQYPVFKKRLKYIKIEVPYLLGDANAKKQSN